MGCYIWYTVLLDKYYTRVLIWCQTTVTDTCSFIIIILHLRVLEAYTNMSNYYILMLESMLVHMHSLYALSLYGTDCLLILCYLPISNNLKWQSKTLTFGMHLLVKIEFKNSSRYAIFSHLCFYFFILIAFQYVYCIMFVWFYLHLCFISCSLSVSS